MPTNNKEADLAILTAATAGFAAFEPKFRRGMEVYDTTIIAKDPVNEAKQEVLDLWAYLHAAEYKVQQAHAIVARCVSTYAMHPDVTNELLRVLALLKPQPLAQKNLPKREVVQQQAPPPEL